MSNASLLAQHLRALRWGGVEGPRRYDDLPAALRGVAREADAIGDRLAQFRVSVFGADQNPEDAILQVQMIAHVVAECVLAPLSPDEGTVWLRRELEGEAFQASSLDAALRFYAAGGQPNVFREGRAVGWPALRDVVAFQGIAQAILEMCDLVLELEGLEGVEPTTPVQCLEDFAREHAERVGAGCVLRAGWEEHPVGEACFDAVRASRHIPIESAHHPDSPPEPEEPWRSSGGLRPR